MLPGPPVAPRTQQGIALIAVLLLLVFILTIVGGLFYRHQIHIQKVTRTFVGDQALLLLLSAESWAKSVLEEDEASSDIDHLGEIWARDLPVLPVEGGRISGCLQDAQGLFAINSLAWYSNASWDQELENADGPTSRRRMMASIMELVGLDNSDRRIAALVDWLDEDAWLLSPDSAEDNEYLLLDPPYRAANRGLADLSELSLVQGFDGGDVARLAPWLNLVTEDLAINVNTAPDLILVALSPHIAPGHVEALVAQRPFASVGEFYTQLAGVVGQPRQDLLADIPAEFVTVASTYFTLRAQVELAGVRMNYSSLIRRGSGTAVVLSRTLQPLPPPVDGGAGPTTQFSGCMPSLETGDSP